jgi:hypothetical protein
VRRVIGAAVLFLTMASVVSTAYPSLAGTAADDLKQIEYRYYFRGRYQQAIEALQTFLARIDLAGPETLRAREVLAASYVLGGAPAMGREVFAGLIAADPSYPGPDPTIFKLEVVNACAEARADHAARNILTVPAGDAAPPLAMDGGAEPVTATGKPFYRQWWLYAGAAALLVAGVAVAGGGGGSDAPPATGTVVVGVRVQ